MTGKELEDDDTLASIHPNLHGVRWLKFYSCSYNIQWDEEGSPHSQFKTFLNKDLRSYGFYWSKVVTEELGPRKSQGKEIPMVLPGSTIEYF